MDFDGASGQRGSSIKVLESSGVLPPKSVSGEGVSGMMQGMCTTSGTLIQRYMYAYKSTKTLRGIDMDAAMMEFNIENLAAKQALLDAKDKHARRGQTKEGTYRLKGFFFSPMPCAP